MVNEEELSHYTSMELREQLIKVKDRIGPNFSHMTLTLSNALEFNFTIYVSVIDENRNIIYGYPGDTPQEAFEALLDRLDEEEASSFGWPWWSEARSDAKTRDILKEIADRHGFS